MTERDIRTHSWNRPTTVESRQQTADNKLLEFGSTVLEIKCYYSRVVVVDKKKSCEVKWQTKFVCCVYAIIMISYRWRAKNKVALQF